MDRQPTRHATSLGLSDVETDQLLFKNAERFLGLDHTVAHS
jgi:hypothetical protein